MMRVLIMFAGVLALSLPAMAQDASQQAATMKAKLASGDKSLPSGYEIPGPTYYYHDAWRGNTIVHPNSTAHPKRFWSGQDNTGGGVGAGAAGGTGK